MKKKLLIALLAITLVVGVFSASAIAASADTPAPEMDIAYCNLSFRDTVCIKYAVKANTEDVKILIWTAPETEYVVGTQDDEITEYYSEKISGVSHMVFDYTKLTAKQMGDVVYARAYAQVDGVDYYSEVNKYSILQYVHNKLTSATTGAELKEMLTNMLSYGASAQKYFDYKEDRLVTAAWYEVKLTAGTLSDGSKSGLFLPGDTVTLTAPETDANGEAFSHWEDSNGSQVATTTEYGLTVGTINEIYTPMYGAPDSLAFEQSDDCSYYIVTGIGTWTDSNVVIPDTFNGLPVKSIGKDAFSNCNQITSINIPNSITSIGENAFYNCKNITSITLLPNITYIGEKAFYGCDKLVEVINHSSLNIEAKSTEYGHVAYYAFEVHNGKTKIVNKNDFLFYTYKKDSINRFPFLVGYVGNDTSITLPEENHTGDAYSIYKYAFYNNSNLESVTIPIGIIVGDYAFENCVNLSSANILGSHLGTGQFKNCVSLENVILAGKITSISASAFEKCTSLVNIDIPDSVTSIRDDAFKDCTSLVSITIPDSVTSLNGGAFENCTSLVNVTIGNGLNKIQTDTFRGCTSLTHINIPDTVTIIGYCAFYDCSGLTTIVVGNSLTQIDGFAFSRTNLMCIYYKGTPAEWQEIEMAYGVPDYTDKLCYYSATRPTYTAYAYWHYVDGVPTAW